MRRPTCLIRWVSNFPEYGKVFLSFDQGERYLERLLDDMRFQPAGPTVSYAAVAHLIPAAARITEGTDLLDPAVAAAEPVLASPSTTPNLLRLVRTGMALVAVVRGDIPAARESYTALMGKPYSAYYRPGMTFSLPSKKPIPMDQSAKRNRTP